MLSIHTGYFSIKPYPFYLAIYLPIIEVYGVNIHIGGFMVDFEDILENRVPEVEIEVLTIARHTMRSLLCLRFDAMVFVVKGAFFTLFKKTFWK